MVLRGELRYTNTIDVRTLGDNHRRRGEQKEEKYYNNTELNANRSTNNNKTV